MKDDPYLKAFLASLPTGAVIGFAFGFATRVDRPPRPLFTYLDYHGWLDEYTYDAVFWLVAGAFVAGMAVYIWRLLHSN